MRLYHLRKPVWWKICLHREVLCHPSIIHPRNQSPYAHEHTLIHTLIHAQMWYMVNVGQLLRWNKGNLEILSAFSPYIFLCKSLGTQIKSIQIILLIMTYSALCLNFSNSFPFKYITLVKVVLRWEIKRNI